LASSLTQTVAALASPCYLVFCSGRPPKRFRKNEDDNVNDLSGFIGRGFSSLKSIASRTKSIKRRTSNDVGIGSDDLSPTAAAAADKLPV
jgi:hypothetical protein